MSDWRDFKALSIDGEARSLHEWRAYAQQQLQEGYGIAAIEGILEFVVEWSNRKDFIETRTSGSTGRPRNIRIRKEHILASAQRTLTAFDLRPGDAALLCLPNRFIGGKMMIARSIIGGLNLHIAEDGATPTVPEGIDIAFAAVVPYQVHNILRNADITSQWQRVKKILIGGGHVDPKLETILRQWPNEVYESFGMTETISHIALRRISGTMEREPFRALEGIGITRDERDCLVIHSEALPANPTVTNDIVELVDERSFHWMGRADNLINSGGVKIIPETIEKVAKPHLNTKFFFAGLPDEALGEKVVLIMESQPLSREDEESLLRELRHELHKYEMPREIHYLDEFAETENGKINRKKTLKKLSVHT